MPRWELGSRDRLKTAAIELFDEQGFENTSVIEVAQRARVTPRTFFRYFSDKREVLFAEIDQVQAGLVEMIRTAPDPAQPLRLVVSVLARFPWENLGPREIQRRRRAVIEANPELLERDLFKHYFIGIELTNALRARGVEAGDAGLAAQIGLQIFYTAYGRWIAGDGKTDLPTISERVMAKVVGIMPDQALATAAKPATGRASERVAVERAT